MPESLSLRNARCRPWRFDTQRQATLAPFADTTAWSRLRTQPTCRRPSGGRTRTAFRLSSALRQAPAESRGPALFPHAHRAWRADCAVSFAMGQDGMSSAQPQPVTTFQAYRAGLAATWTSVFSYVLFGNYMGIGALAHDFGFSLPWALACTIVVWAGPAQVILISALGGGASL